MAKPRSGERIQPTPQGVGWRNKMSLAERGKETMARRVDASNVKTPMVPDPRNSFQTCLDIFHTPM